MIYDYLDDPEAASFAPPAIPVNGPDIPPIPQAMPEQGPQFGPPQQPGFVGPHTLTIQNGLQPPRDFHFQDGQINPQELAQDEQRTLQALQQAGANQYGSGGISSQPFPSGPHPDRFDYEFTPAQQQRIAQLNREKDILLHRRDIHPGVQRTEIAAREAEIHNIKPVPKPKQSDLQTQFQQEVITDPKTGLQWTREANGTWKSHKTDEGHADRPPSMVEMNKMINDRISQSYGQKNADGTSKSPMSADEARKQVYQEYEDHRKMFGHGGNLRQGTPAQQANELTPAEDQAAQTPQVDPALPDMISASRKKGKSNEDIVKGLKLRGYTDQQIADALKQPTSAPFWLRGG